MSNLSSSLCRTLKAVPNCNIRLLKARGECTFEISSLGFPVMLALFLFQLHLQNGKHTRLSVKILRTGKMCLRKLHLDSFSL